jgi:hypothetical protein
MAPNELGDDRTVRDERPPNHAGHKTERQHSNEIADVHGYPQPPTRPLEVGSTSSGSWATSPPTVKRRGVAARQVDIVECTFSRETSSVNG